MNFGKIFFCFFAIVLAICSVSAAPEPGWKFLKKIEHAGRRVRDGVIKAGPAVAVVGQAATIAKG